MKLEKAIELLQLKVKFEYSASKTDEGDAVKLGIEALKARKVWQDNEGFDLKEALPGETA